MVTVGVPTVWTSSFCFEPNEWRTSRVSFAFAARPAFRSTLPLRFGADLSG